MRKVGIVKESIVERVDRSGICLFIYIYICEKIK